MDYITEMFAYDSNFIK